MQNIGSLVGSVKTFHKDVLVNFNKYPLTSILVIAMSILSLLVVNDVIDNQYNKFLQIFLAFFFVFTLESQKVNKFATWIVFILSIFLLFIHASANPISIFVINIHVWLISLLFPLAWFGWQEKDENKALSIGSISVGKAFFSVAIATLVFASIGFFLLLIDRLLDINVPSKLITSISAIIFSFFAPMLFMTIFDKELPILLENRYGFLAKYILIPSTGLYFTILYIYFFKIIISGSVPRNQIGYLVLTSSFVGIVSAIISYPLKDKERWAGLFNIYLSSILIFPVAMVIWSVGIRINEYGFTISRYSLLAYFIWLLAFCFWTTYKRGFSYRIFIQSIYLIIFSTLLIWPLSPYQVSFESQKNHILKNFKKDASGKYEMIGRFSAVKSSIDYANSIFEDKTVWEYLPVEVKGKFVSAPVQKKSKDAVKTPDFVSHWSQKFKKLTVQKIQKASFSSVVEISDLTDKDVINSGFYQISMKGFKLHLKENISEYEFDLTPEIEAKLNTTFLANDFVVSKNHNGKHFVILVKEFYISVDKKSFISFSGTILF